MNDWIIAATIWLVIGMALEYGVLWDQNQRGNPKPKRLVSIVIVFMWPFLVISLINDWIRK